MQQSSAGLNRLFLPLASSLNKFSKLFSEYKAEIFSYYHIDIIKIRRIITYGKLRHLIKFFVILEFIANIIFIMIVKIRGIITHGKLGYFIKFVYILDFITMMITVMINLY